MTAAWPPTLAELKAGRRTAARIVLHYGEVYLPIFLRLDREVEERRGLLQRVRAIAAGDEGNRNAAAPRSSR